MALTIRSTAPVNRTQDMENDLLVRINGTLPDLSIIGGEEKSEITVGSTHAAARLSGMFFFSPPLQFNIG